MKMKKTFCVLLALILIVLCLTGCRNDKQEMAEEAEGQTSEEQEKPAGIEVSEDPLEIVVPEDMEIDGGGVDFGG